MAVVSILDDKDAAAMLRALLPLCDHVVFTSNAQPARALAGRRSPRWPASSEGADGEPVERDPHAALAARPRARRRRDGVVLATGSIYLIADLPAIPAQRARLDAVNDDDGPQSSSR